MPTEKLRSTTSSSPFRDDRERSKASSQAGRALDVRIAETFWGFDDCGWPVNEAEWKWWIIDEDGVRCPRLPQFSTNIADAWAVLDLMAAPGFWVNIKADGAGQFTVEWMTHDEDDKDHWLAEVCDVDSAPLAICLAALRETDV